MTRSVYKFPAYVLKSVLFKKILEKPSGTQNLQKLPRHLALISWGSFCKFCVPDGFSRIFLNKTDFSFDQCNLWFFGMYKFDSM